MPVISVPLWDPSIWAPSGQIFSLTSSSIKEIWKKLKDLTSLWCAIEPQLTLLEVKLGSSSTSLCQFSNSWPTSAQKSILFNSRQAMLTLTNGRSELTLKRDKKKRRTKWKKFLPKLSPTVRLLKVSMLFTRLTNPSLWTKKLSKSEDDLCYLHWSYFLYLFHYLPSWSNCKKKN